MKKLLVSLLASSVMLVACGQKTQTEAEEQEKQEQVADAQQTDNVAIESVNDQSSQENKDKEKSVEDVTKSPSEESGDESEAVNELEQWLPKTPNVERIYTVNLQSSRPIRNLFMRILYRSSIRIQG